MNVIPKAIVPSRELEVVHIIGEVDRNNFFDDSAQPMGGDPGDPNINVFVMTLSYDAGLRRWAYVAGDPVYDDSFQAAEYFNGNLMILQTSSTGLYSEKGTSDVIYTRLRSETGE